MFDDIFVSCDFNAKKADGSLYRKVIEKIGIQPKDVMMIGDNPVSDYKMAKANGIKPRLRFRLLYKLSLKLKMKTGYDFSKSAINKIINNCYKYSLPFSEYSTIYFSFTERLSENLEPKSIPVFLAREGYFLKTLFEKYEYLLKKDSEIHKTHYFLSSRRSITSTNVQEVCQKVFDENIHLIYCLYTAGFTDEEIQDFKQKHNLTDEQMNSYPQQDMIEILKQIIPAKVENNKRALYDYAKEIIENNSDNTPVHFIDIGWKGSMQKGIESIFKINTKGFYVGTTGDSLDPVTDGLVFSYSKSLINSTYYDVLNTNIQLYESLASAPHGSAQTYTYKDGQVVVPLRWVENEKALYENTIESWQKNALEWFSACAAWSDKDKINVSNKRNANTVLKSALFANKKRRDFTRELDKGFVWNFGQDVKGLNYKSSGVKIGLSIFYKPESYVHYFAKIQRLLPEKKLVHMLYYCFAFAVSLYVKLILKLKRAK